MPQAGELSYAYFFICDIVGLSSPTLKAKRQIKKVEALTSIVKSCEAFKNTNPSTMFYLPTGDGLALGFLQGPELPLMLATELHKKLGEYNVGKFNEDVLGIRIGINDGVVVSVNDALGNTNVWGPGLILARSVMDIGDDLHILLSPNTAEALREGSPEYKEMIKPLHDFKINEQRYLLYSAYLNGVGKPNPPVNDKAKKSKYQVKEMKEDLKKMRGTMILRKIALALEISDTKSMLTHHNISYNIENKSKEPIQTALHCIKTNVKKSFNDLKIQVSDESGTELKLTNVNYETDYQKEFRTRYAKPIVKGEKGRGHRLEYQVEEPKRRYEFQPGIYCKKIAMSILYPSNTKFRAAAYAFTEKHGKKKSMSKMNLNTKKLAEGTIMATCNITNVPEDRIFRLEW